MRKRMFRLSRPCFLAFFTLLAAPPTSSQGVADQAKKPEEPPPVNQPASGDPASALQPAAAEQQAADTPTNSPPATAEEVQAMIERAITELRQYVGASSDEILERTARDANELSRKVDETLSSRLDLVEHSLAQSQQRHFDAVREANRSFLMQAGIFGGLGFLGVVIAAVVLARSINRFSRAAFGVSGGQLALSPAGDRLAFVPGDAKASVPAQFEQASTRFSEGVERLLKRIDEWEQVMGRRFAQEPGRPGHPSRPRVAGGALGESPGGDAPRENSAADEAGSEVSVLLGKGHALMNLGQMQEAIACFDRAIACDPGNPTSFVRKGLAFEKMQKLDQALESYDRAIALDDTLTLAYLYKGAVLGRLKRFQEALACYEKALQAEQKLLAV